MSVTWAVKQVNSPHISGTFYLKKMSVGRRLLVALFEYLADIIKLFSGDQLVDSANDKHVSAMRPSDSPHNERGGSGRGFISSQSWVAARAANHGLARDSQSAGGRRGRPVD